MRITEEEYHDHSNNYDGFCTHCEEFSEGGVEPDAEGYHCDYCDTPSVCGTEQALFLGVLDIK